MTALAQVADWIDRYVRAWNTNDPADIADLYTADATYRGQPYALGLHGREAIVADWLARQDEPGSTTFTWHPVALTDEVAVVEGTTTYPTQVFRNLWVLRLDPDGRCREFTEWWMQEPSTVD
jgi:uncharacterized protein (TIGR02246 family)